MSTLHVVPLFDEDINALQRRVEGYITREFHTRKAFSRYVGLSQTTISRGLRDGFGVLGTVALLAIQDALRRLDADSRDAATQLAVGEAQRNAKRAARAETHGPHRYTREETAQDRVDLRDALAPLFDLFNSAEDFHRAVALTLGYKRPSATLYRALFGQTNYPQAEWVWRILRQIAQQQDEIRAHANGQAPISSSHRHVVKVDNATPRSGESVGFTAFADELFTLEQQISDWFDTGITLFASLQEFRRRVQMQE